MYTKEDSLTQSHFLNTHTDKFMVTLATFISHTGKVGVPLLTVLANHGAVIVLILPQEAFWVVVTVNIDLGECIVCGWFYTALMNTGLQPWQKQLQAVDNGILQF